MSQLKLELSHLYQEHPHPDSLKYGLQVMEKVLKTNKIKRESWFSLSDLKKTATSMYELNVAAMYIAHGRGRVKGTSAQDLLQLQTKKRPMVSIAARVSFCFHGSANRRTEAGKQAVHALEAGGYCLHRRVRPDCVERKQTRQAEGRRGGYNIEYKLVRTAKVEGEASKEDALTPPLSPHTPLRIVDLEGPKKPVPYTVVTTTTHRKAQPSEDAKRVFTPTVWGSDVTPGSIKAHEDFTAAEVMKARRVFDWLFETYRNTLKASANYDSLRAENKRLKEKLNNIEKLLKP